MKHLPFLYLVILYNMINSRLYFVQYMDFIVDETVYHVTLQNCSLYDFLKKNINTGQGFIFGIGIINNCQ